ncbi:MAG: BACON domain-containing protein [Bacteroidales bacterium]|nr:BACON domain-containing protein [Bacteroidales bacterium]
MKLKYLYLFPLLIAMLATMTSCDEDQTATMLDEIKVSSSYVAIPEAGGSQKITINAKDSWTVEKVTTDKDPVEWLTLSSTSGSAGESTLTFTAPSAIDGRTAEVLLKSGGKTQRINIIQGLPVISEATVAQAKAAPDGKTLRLSGVVTKIENTLYGNWRLMDDTGEILIYGTLDKKGAEKNFESLGIEVGDEVTIEGPKGTHSGNAQMVNVMVIELRKSLIQIDSLANDSLPIEGGEFTAMLSVKGDGVSVDIPEDAKSWLSIAAVESAGEEVVVIFNVAPNTGGDRGTTIKFRTVQEGKTYSTETSIFQKGAIVKATIAEFIAAEVGDTQYRLSGVITKIDEKYNNNITISDFSGEVYVYRLNLNGKEYKVGDIVTVVGKRGEYNGAQVANGILESVIPVTPITIAELLTKEVSTEVYYMVTGDIKEITNASYGNHYLEQDGSSIEVYGTYPGYGATGDFRKNLFADKGIVVGDQLTVIGTRGVFGEKAQLANGIYFSHESAE